MRWLGVLVLMPADVLAAKPIERAQRYLPGPLRELGPIEVESARTTGNRFDAKTWQRVKTYDMPELKKIEPLPMREIVGVRFNYRQETIEHWKPNWYRGSIWRYQRKAQDEFDYIPVLVSKADLEAFKAVATDFRGPREYVVFGQVLKDVDANFIFLRLIGTKVKRDRAGRVTVSW